MRRPDGLLNHNVLGEDKGPQDACGVFGVWAPGEEVAKLSFYGLYELDHRHIEQLHRVEYELRLHDQVPLQSKAQGCS